MKATKVFVFDGGRSGYIQLEGEEGKLLPFYCYSGDNVAQTKLDISFKKGSEATTNMKGIARQAIFTYRENNEKSDLDLTVETQGNKNTLKKVVPQVPEEIPVSPVEPDANDETEGEKTDTDSSSPQV